MTLRNRILFVEGNKNNRKAASDELSMKLLVWGHAAPPMKITCSPSPVDAVVYEKAKVLINGTVFIEEDQISRSSQDDFDLPELTDEENER